MTTLDFVGTTSALVSTPSANRFGIALIQLHDELWRVTRRAGDVLGYIEAFDDAGIRRFRAKRMFSSRRPTMPLGEFWTIEDAVDCFRFS